MYHRSFVVYYEDKDWKENSVGLGQESRRRKIPQAGFFVQCKFLCLLGKEDQNGTMGHAP